MYSKHRQKNAQISPAKCGRLLVFLSFLLLSGTLERASGNTGEQGKKRERRADMLENFFQHLPVALELWSRAVWEL